MVDLNTYVTCGMCTLECIQVNVLGIGKSLCLLVCALVRWEPATSGSGIPQVDAEVMDRVDAFIEKQKN